MKKRMELDYLQVALQVSEIAPLLHFLTAMSRIEPERRSKKQEVLF